jgi:hypothetical protein
VDSAWEQKNAKPRVREMLAVGHAHEVPKIQCIIILVLMQDALLGAVYLTLTYNLKAVESLIYPKTNLSSYSKIREC